MADETYAAAELASKLRNEPGEHVSPYAGLVDNRRDLELLQRLDRHLSVPVEETAAGKEILSRAATQTIDESVRNGNVSQMKSATGMTTNQSDEGSFYWEVGGRLATEGTIGLVFGSPGSGKTAKILDSGMAWKGRTNGRIFGNIEADILDEEFYSDREMFERMAAYKGQSLALIDEVAQSLDGFGSRNTSAQEFVNRLRMIRKKEQEHGPYAKRGSALLVAHTRNGTAKDIRRMASFAIEIPNKHQRDRAVILDSKDGSDEFSRYESYAGISDTTADYDEHQSSEFEITAGDDSDDSEVEAWRSNIGQKDPYQVRLVQTLYNVHDWTQSEIAQCAETDLTTQQAVSSWTKLEVPDSEYLEPGELPSTIKVQ